MTSPRSKATSAVRASIESDTQHRAVVPPLHLSSNFAFASFGEKGQYDYTLHRGILLVYISACIGTSAPRTEGCWTLRPR